MPSMALNRPSLIPEINVPPVHHVVTVPTGHVPVDALVRPMAPKKLPKLRGVTAGVVTEELAVAVVVVVLLSHNRPHEANITKHTDRKIMDNPFFKKLTAHLPLFIGIFTENIKRESRYEKDRTSMCYAYFWTPKLHD